MKQNISFHYLSEDDSYLPMFRNACKSFGIFDLPERIDNYPNNPYDDEFDVMTAINHSDETYDFLVFDPNRLYVPKDSLFSKRLTKGNGKAWLLGIFTDEEVMDDDTLELEDAEQLIIRSSQFCSNGKSKIYQDE